MRDFFRILFIAFFSIGSLVFGVYLFYIDAPILGLGELAMSIFPVALRIFDK